MTAPSIFHVCALCRLLAIFHRCFANLEVEAVLVSLWQDIHERITVYGLC
jgi:hypothetical protein